MTAAAMCFWIFVFKGQLHITEQKCDICKVSLAYSAHEGGACRPLGGRAQEGGA